MSPGELAAPEPVGLGLSSDATVKDMLAEVYDVDEEVLDDYEDIRTQDPEHAVEMFGRIMDTGKRMFKLQWKETYGEDDNIIPGEPVRDEDYIDEIHAGKYGPFCVDRETSLKEVGDILEKSAERHVYDSWRDVGRAAWRTDKDYVLGTIGGVAGLVGIGAGAVLAPDTSDQWETVLEMTIGSGSVTATAWGLKNLYRKYWTINLSDYVSKRGQTVFEEFRKNYYILDPDFKKLGGGEFGERIYQDGQDFLKYTDFDSVEEWEQARQLPEHESRHSCKFLLAVFDPTLRKEKFWNVVETYFPEREFENLKDMEESGVAYTPSDHNSVAPA